jgi:hypothetical protein
MSPDIKRLRAIACAERLPCFQLALRDRALPSGVLGPVEGPPCTQQRPLGIAGALQGPPCDLVRAPHLGALWELPLRLGLPFSSVFDRASWGCLFI